MENQSNLAPLHPDAVEAFKACPEAMAHFNQTTPVVDERHRGAARAVIKKYLPWPGVTENELAQFLAKHFPSQPPVDSEVEEEEQARWQKAIYEFCLKVAPDALIDGKGCDSGDPLDFTLEELRQAFDHLENRTFEEAKRLREALEKIANMPHYDQDDEHRLRHFAKEALSSSPQPSTSQPQPRKEGDESH